jgi:hypothetical protein
VTVLLQAALSYGLLMRQFRLKLGPQAPPAIGVAQPVPAGADTVPP